MEPIAVCICTYRRPLQLARLLKILAEIPRPSVTMFVIVDNDGSSGKTESAVHNFQILCGAPVKFIVETEPGLSAARNAALRVARRAGARTVALLDDDEWPSPQWLTKLIETQSRSGAAVVGGPVHPVFPTGSVPLKKYGTLWSVQKGRLAGRTHVYCTCNCLLDLSAVEFLGDQPFPLEFGFTGGEDVVFFRRLHSAGVRMAWSDDAIAFEEISAERASLGWLRRRWYRLGNIGVKCERAAPIAGALPPLPKTILLALRFLIYPLVNLRVLTMPLLWLLEAERIRGRLASHVGTVVMQYGREEAHGRQCE
jgi:succinoglycan biosynthesis protein ExoM